MERVLGIGGVFFKSQNPAELRQWYATHLGIPDAEFGHMFEGEGQTVWAPFEHDTTYFAPSEKPFMINYRVENLERMLAQLRAANVWVDEKVEAFNYGKFGWAMDPEGNRFELWEPPAE